MSVSTLYTLQQTTVWYFVWWEPVRSQCYMDSKTHAHLQITTMCHGGRNSRYIVSQNGLKENPFLRRPSLYWRREDQNLGIHAKSSKYCSIPSPTGSYGQLLHAKQIWSPKTEMLGSQVNNQKLSARCAEIPQNWFRNPNINGV